MDPCPFPEHTVSISVTELDHNHPVPLMCHIADGSEASKTFHYAAVKVGQSVDDVAEKTVTQHFSPYTVARVSFGLEEGDVLLVVLIPRDVVVHNWVWKREWLKTDEVTPLNIISENPCGSKP